jgi:hypothetical protein
MVNAREMTGVTIHRAMAHVENINVFYRDTRNVAQPLL